MNDVRTADASDASVVGSVLADGFHDDPVMMWLFAGDDDRRAAKLQCFFGFIAEEATIPLGATFVVDGACACWTPPPGTDEWPEDRGIRLDQLLRRECDDGDMARLGVLSSTMDAAHPSEPHWYLGSIATTRARQGAGLGSALLHHSLAIVDEAGAPAYLESSNIRNVPLYERHGFRRTGQIDLPAGPSLVTMWRPPRRP